MLKEWMLMAKFESSGIDELLETMGDLNKIEVECTTCGKKLEIDLEKHPKHVTCTKCKTLIELTYDD